MKWRHTAPSIIRELFQALGDDFYFFLLGALIGVLLFGTWAFFTLFEFDILDWLA